MAKKINKVLTTQPVPLDPEEVQNLGLTLSAVLEGSVLDTEALWVPSVTDQGTLSWRLGRAGDPGPSPVNIAGPQGPTGPQGPQGAVGDKGDKGDQGIQGIPGPSPVIRIDPTNSHWQYVDPEGHLVDLVQTSSGMVGPQGEKGETGSTGETGPRGLGLSAEVHTIEGGNEVSIWKETGTEAETSFNVMDGKDISAKAYPTEGGGIVEFWKDGATEKHAELFLASGTSGYTPRAHVDTITGGHHVSFYLPNVGGYDVTLAEFDVMDGSTAGALEISGSKGIKAVKLGTYYDVSFSGECYIDTLSAQSAVNAGHAAFADLAQSAAVADVAHKYYSSDLSQPMEIGQALDGIWNCVSALPDSTIRQFPVYAEYAQSAYLGSSTVSSFPQFKTAIDENKSAIQANATEIGKKIETVNHDATLSGDGKNTALGLINAYKQAIETVSGKVNAYPGSGSENKDWIWHVNQNGSGSWYEAATWINPINGLSGYGNAMDGKYYVGINTSAMTNDKRYVYKMGTGWDLDPVQLTQEITGLYSQGGTNYQHMDNGKLMFYKAMIHEAGTTSASEWANDNIIHIILEA